jgi:hypothetical protein
MRIVLLVNSHSMRIRESRAKVVKGPQSYIIFQKKKKMLSVILVGFIDWKTINLIKKMRDL